MFVHSAFIAAKLYLIPIFLPFLSPRKGFVANWTNFEGKIFFFDAFHEINNLNDVLWFSVLVNI
jgi:hypothetical protein